MRHIAGAWIVALSITTIAFAGERSKISFELRQSVDGSVAAQSTELVQVVIQTTDIMAAREALVAAGGRLESSAGDLLLARLPASSLEKLAASSAVSVIRKPRAPEPLSTTSEAVSAIGATAWHAAGRKGAGVKVAILDIGFQDYQSLMGSELPTIPPSHVKSFRSDGDITGESDGHGTAVAEIIYDIAPQADLYLANFSNEVELENAVQWLIEQHVDVVNTSWGYPCGGPLDGTGSINALVKRAADAGILWVASAGNYAQRHWTGRFSDTDSDGWHNYSGEDEGNSVHMESGDELRVCVEWDDWTQKNEDLDLYVYDSDGYVVESSRESQSGPNTHDPWERLTFTANSTGDYIIAVKRFAGTRAVTMQMYAYEPGSECAMEKAVAAAPAEADGLLAELRQFRDRVLSSTPFGRALVKTYYRHSKEVTRALLLHPRLGLDAASLLKTSRPALRSVTDANAERFVITSDYANRIDAFFDSLSAIASPELRADLDAFRSAASFSTAAGQNADQYWTWLLEQAPPGAVAASATFPDPGFMQYVTRETSLVPPGDSASAFTAGAFDWSNNTLEDFSSQGPTADGRLKPDISGPDGVCTVTYADCGGDAFRGTSAAAPHVAGAAALVIQAYPTRSLSEIRSFLTGRATDMLDPGPDNRSGAGRLNLGTTTDVDLLPAPALTRPMGNDAEIWPVFQWSSVAGAASYRVMVAASASALPSDPAVQTCSGCQVNTTTNDLSYVPAVSLIGGETYYWQVQGRVTGKNGLWSSRASFKTALSPELTACIRTDLPEEAGQWATPGQKAVAITHGFLSEAAPEAAWAREMAEKFCGRLDALKTAASARPDTLTKICQSRGWDVWILDWSGQAGPPNAFVPWTAFRNAQKVGEMLARNFEGKMYASVHFIAHSAGSNLIHSATESLRNARPNLRIHETFLDAYDPSDDTTRYGQDADWADNYVDTRGLVGFYPGRDGTQLFLANGFNVDVTPSGSDPCDAFLVAAMCRHSRPYRFYGHTVNGAFVGESRYEAADPVSNTALGGMGYTQSAENGKDFSGLNAAYPKNWKCVPSGSVCTAQESSFATVKVVIVNVARSVKTIVGTVSWTPGAIAKIVFGKIRLGFIPWFSTPPDVVATATESPSYIVADVTTTDPVDKMRFTWRFNTSGEGFLRVVVDGMVVREIDQRFVPAASTNTEEIYIGGPAGVLQPGTHHIAFRLDGFGANASGIEIGDVELGLTSPGAPRRRAIRH